MRRLRPSRTPVFLALAPHALPLRAPRDNGDHEVFLEQSTLQAFLEFLDALPIKRGT